MIKEYLKKIKWETLFTAVFAIAIGILFLIFPSSTSNVLCYVAGGIFLALGIVYFTRFLTGEFIFGSYVLIFSILLAVFGLFCIIKPSTIKAIITVVFGLFLVLDGVVKMQEGIECARANVKNWWIMIALSMLTITLGVVVMFGTFDNVMIFAGISLIIDGICDIITTLVFSSKFKKAEKAIKEIVIEENK